MIIAKAISLVLGMGVSLCSVCWLVECGYALGPFKFTWREVRVEVALGIASLAVGLTLIASSAIAADAPLPRARPLAYPTVPELEGSIGYSPGAPIKDFQWGGRTLHVSYVKARAIGNGEYDVRIRLR